MNAKELTNKLKQELKFYTDLGFTYIVLPIDLIQNCIDVLENKEHGQSL